MKRLVFILCCFFISTGHASSAFVNPVPHQHHHLIWRDIRAGFKLNHHENNKTVQSFIRYYQLHRPLFKAVMESAAPYLFFILQTTKTRQLPAELTLLPFVESGYRPEIQSLSGALGLWQMMPDTANDFNILVDSYWFDGREDLAESTYGALDLLSFLHHYFNNDWLLAIAAYNSGIGTVKNALNKRRGASRLRGDDRHKNHSDFWQLALPHQTRDYVPKLLAISAIVANPRKYGMTLPRIGDTAPIEKVMLKKQITLSEAAKLAGVSFNTLNALNPAYLFNITPNTGPSYLYIPSSKVNHFIYELNHHHLNEHWRLYRIRKGEYLGEIAKRFNTSTQNLIDRNDLASVRIQPHQPILVPSHKKHARDTYRVHSGDTLAKIADHFGTSTVKLARINGVDPKASLRVGQYLLVD